jgi:hypothetical protein
MHVRQVGLMGWSLLPKVRHLRPLEKMQPLERTLGLHNYA